MEKGDNSHRWPQVLPGGDSVLFTANASVASASIDVLSIKTGQWKVVQSGGYFGRYLPSGHLVFVHQNTLFAASFDVSRSQVTGTPMALLDDVASDPLTGATAVAFSRTGTFLYSSGQAQSGTWPIMWMESSGEMQPLVATPATYLTRHLSPDGKRLAISEKGDIWITI